MTRARHQSAGGQTFGCNGGVHHLHKARIAWAGGQVVNTLYAETERARIGNVRNPVDNDFRRPIAPRAIARPYIDGECDMARYDIGGTGCGHDLANGRHKVGRIVACDRFDRQHHFRRAC